MVNVFSFFAGCNNWHVLLFQTYPTEVMLFNVSKLILYMKKRKKKLVFKKEMVKR